MDMQSSAPRRPVVGLLIALVACFAVAALGGWATSTSVETWYTTLNKPSFNPPNWLFGPVWSVLYAMMGLAAWRVWLQDGRLFSAPLGIFAVQLLLNLAWSVLFFGLRAPAAALADLVLLIAAVALTIRLFAPRDRIAAWLLAPYLAWITFAATLNLAIVMLN